MHRAILLDVDLRAGVCRDFFDRFATGSDNETDLFRLNLYRDDTRRVLRQSFTRRGDNGVHLVQNKQPRDARLLERTYKYVTGNPLDLRVKLKCGDTRLSARNLEIHIAGKVFHALDIRQYRVVIALGDKSPWRYQQRVP